MKNCTLYTIQRIKKDDTLYGSVHGSADGETTLCGRVCDENWYITNNTFDGKITCKSCLIKLNIQNHPLGYKNEN